jgi:hypothetical protein
MQGPRGGTENTSDQNRNGNDMDMNIGGNMPADQNGMRNGQMDRERMRVNETGSRSARLPSAGSGPRFAAAIRTVSPALATEGKPWQISLR